MKFLPRTAALPVDPLALVAISFALGAVACWLLGSAFPRRMTVSQPVSDSVLTERARARVNQLVSEPDAIDVTVDDGVVRVAGPVSWDERDALLADLIRVPGVRRVRNGLQPPAVT